MIEDIPILSINVKIWKFCSVILSQNYWRRYMFVGPVAVMNAMQFVYLYQQWGDIRTFIFNAFYAIAIFNALLRTCLVIINRTQFEAFMMEVANLYIDIEGTDDFAKDILKKATLGARKISIFNLSASFFDLIGAVLYPLFSQSRIHPYGVAIPGLDLTLSPIYEIIYILQLSSPIVLTSMYMPFVSLFASYAMLGTAILKIIQRRLGQVYSPSKPEETVYRDLVACIKYHMRIIRFVEDLNSLVTYIVFAEFLIFSTILCALLFCLNIIDSPMQSIAVIMYILTMLYVLFTYYWQANELLTESIEVSEAAYDIEWFHCSQRCKKALLLFIMRSQKPLMIMVGNIYPMTLETFQSLLNASYSYFTILRGVYK